MNPNELLRIVDSLHREKNIDTEIVFQAIEAALVSAVRRQFGEETEIVVHIDRTTGSMQAVVNGNPLDEDTIGRIGAQTAKQVIIQKIREAERDSLVQEFSGQIDDTAAVQAAIDAACTAGGAAGRRIIGIHLEGPFISPETGPRGTHPLEHVRLPALPGSAHV